jgi:hypothetical protein
MTAIDAEDFRALARSSPWRWRTVQLVVQYVGAYPENPRPVRAFVARPAGIRVEELDGTLISAMWDRPHTPNWPSNAAEFRVDGLLARRPDEHDPYQFDDPMFGSYRWVSMLNPFELADGAPFENGHVDGLWSADLAPIVVHGGVSDGEWNGRRVWTAVVEATENYASRCSCCPVLVGDHSVRRLAQENNGMTVPQRQWPQAQQVRLDVQTGILVQLEEIGGHRPRDGWTAQIEAVDLDLPKALFDG